ncbi:MAG: hypothetical protein MZV65_36075 [Chromatiales bacterium]|nr:hypothetical protein [Chromatiales bacterium]
MPGDYALWLINPEGETFLAKPGVELRPAKPGDPGIGEADGKGIPAAIEGYQRLNPLFAATDKNLAEHQVWHRREAKRFKYVRQARPPSCRSAYDYDEATDTMVDQSNGEIYYNQDGHLHHPRTAKTIAPGFRTEVGLEELCQILSPARHLRGPLVQIVIWNFIFPTVSVLSTFALGLAIAIMFNEPGFSPQED